jgi:hypothetical protein
VKLFIAIEWDSKENPTREVPAKRDAEWNQSPEDYESAEA